MTSTIGAFSNALYKVAPIILDASGNGTAKIGPSSVSEFWVPTMVRVGTVNQATPVASVSIYHGPSGGNVVDPTTFLDSTALGRGDVSTIVSGIVVQYGEVITAVFTNGNPGDNASLIISGIYTNVPPTIGELPKVPGTHFAGALVPEILQTVSTIPVGSPTPIAPVGGLLTIGPFDVRQWASYYLKIFMTTSGAATAFNVAEADINWFSKANGTDVVYQETPIQWFASCPTGTFFFSGGPMEMQDIQHGPYMSITFSNQASTDTLQLNYTLTFTTRTVTQPILKQQNGLDGTLTDVPSQNLVGGLAQVPLQFGYGDVDILFANNGTNPMNLAIGFGSLSHGFGANTDSIGGSIAAGGNIGRTTTFRRTFPKRSGICNISGTGTDAFSLRVTARLDRS